MWFQVGINKFYASSKFFHARAELFKLTEICSITEASVGNMIFLTNLIKKG